MRKDERSRAHPPTAVHHSSFRIHHFSRPRGVVDLARDPAKVEDQVRFLARTLEKRSAIGFQEEHESVIRTR